MKVISALLVLAVCVAMPALVNADSCFVTLLPQDPLFQGVYLREGVGALSFTNGFVSVPTNLELAFVPPNLVVAPLFPGAPMRIGSVYPLGNEVSLRTSYNVTSGADSLNLIYPTINLVNNTLMIGQNLTSGTSVPLSGANFGSMAQNYSIAHTPVTGDIYIITLNNTADASDNRVIKVKVVSVSNGTDVSSVTLRWDVLQDGKGNTGGCAYNANQGAQFNGVIGKGSQTTLEQFLNVPIWIAATVAVLFVLVVGLIITTIILFVQFRKRSSYNSVP